jgi:hypothetical protein
LFVIYRDPAKPLTVLAYEGVYVRLRASDDEDDSRVPQIVKQLERRDDSHRCQRREKSNESSLVRQRSDAAADANETLLATNAFQGTNNANSGPSLGRSDLSYARDIDLVDAWDG